MNLEKLRITLKTMGEYLFPIEKVTSYFKSIKSKNDLQKLEAFSDIIVYVPNDNDIYEKDIKKKKYNFGHFTKIMEGKVRPGHFDGVTTVVDRFFELIKPNRSYFGEKDYQQILVIKKLIKKINLKN